MVSLECQGGPKGSEGLVSSSNIYLQVRVFGLEEAENSPYNVFCFRIPAVVQTDSGVLLAFAEARIDTCADCAELGIAMRRSEDGGGLK